MEIGFLWIAKKQDEWICDEMSGDKPHQKDPKPKMYLLGYVISDLGGILQVSEAS